MIIVIFHGFIFRLGRTAFERVAIVIFPGFIFRLGLSVLPPELLEISKACKLQDACVPPR